MTFMCSAAGHRKQIMVAIVVGSCMMIEGNIVAWPNVMTDFIQANHDNNIANVSDSSYPVLTDYETSWLASLPSFSTIPFVLFSGTIISIVGLRGSTTIGLILAIVAWLLMGLISSKAALFVGQAISGAALAFIGMVTQPLVSELVSPEIRGATASLPKVFSILGTLEINIANIFLPWYHTTLLCAVPFIIFLFFISFVPESPYWLMKKGRKEAAASALKLLNPSSKSVEEKIQEVKQCVILEGEKPGLIEEMHQMCHSSNYKPVILMATIFVCYGSCGYTILFPYSTLLFSQAGMALDPRLCTIILGVVRLVVVIIGAFFVDLCGRRPLYIGSSILSVLSLVLTFASLTFHFIPKVFVMISLIGFIIFSSVGINTIPLILLGEVIPSAVQSVGCSLCLILESIMYCIFFFVTPLLIYAIPLRFIFLIPAATNLLGPFVVWKWLPETKGRTLLEIQKAFE